MKTAIVFLALAAVGGVLYCNSESMAATREAEDTELRALLVARRDVLKEAAVILRTQRREGNFSNGSVARVNSELLEAELELAESRTDRIKILEASLAMHKETEAMVDSILGAGIHVLGDNYLARADRFLVEIELYKARKAQ